MPLRRMLEQATLEVHALYVFVGLHFCSVSPEEWL